MSVVWNPFHGVYGNVLIRGRPHLRWSPFGVRFRPVKARMYAVPIRVGTSAQCMNPPWWSLKMHNDLNVPQLKTVRNGPPQNHWRLRRSFQKSPSFKRLLHFLLLCCLVCLSKYDFLFVWFECLPQPCSIHGAGSLPLWSDSELWNGKHTYI